VDIFELLHLVSQIGRPMPSRCRPAVPSRLSHPQLLPRGHLIHFSRESNYKISQDLVWRSENKQLPPYHSSFDEVHKSQGVR